MRRCAADRRVRADDGSVLLLVLVMSVVMALVVGVLSSYIISSLRYTRVVEDRSDRLAAADGGLRYAIERLQNSAYAGCLSNLGDAANGGFSIDFPVAVNGADVEINCTKGSSGIGDIKAWAIIVTGQGGAGRAVDVEEPVRRRAEQVARRTRLDLGSRAIRSEVTGAHRGR